jgi:hypothetical protein
MLAYVHVRTGRDLSVLLSNLESFYITDNSTYCYFNNAKIVIFVTDFWDFRIIRLKRLVLIPVYA